LLEKNGHYARLHAKHFNDDETTPESPEV